MNMTSLHLLVVSGFAAFLLSSCSSPSTSSTAISPLPKLIVQRLGWMDKVAQAKQARSLPVNDSKREAELLIAMEKRGADAGLQAQVVRPFFSGQILAAKQRQVEWLANHPGKNLSGKPALDLAKDIRPSLDQIGKNMISELAKARSSHQSSSILLEAQRELSQAGYSKAVMAPALDGLEAGLR